MYLYVTGTAQTHYVLRDSKHARKMELLMLTRQKWMVCIVVYKPAVHYSESTLCGRELVVIVPPLCH
jgi:hypothetical protein